MKVRIKVLVCALLTLLLLTATGSAEATTINNKTLKKSVEKTAAPFTLEEMTSLCGGYYSLNLNEGWTIDDQWQQTLWCIETGNQCSTAEILPLPAINPE